MKTLFTRVLLIGLLLLTAATVKAGEPNNKPDTATHSGFTIYKKASGGTPAHFIYTTGQICAAVGYVIPEATFTSISLEIQGTDVFLLVRGHDNDTPAISIATPIGLTDAGPTYEVSTDMYAMIESCATWICCSECQYTWIGRRCLCSKDAAPDNVCEGGCRKIMIPCICWMGEGPTPAQQFIGYLSQFNPQD